MNKEEYQKLYEDALCYSQNPTPADERRLDEFAARVREYLEERGEPVAWWDGGHRLTRHEALPPRHDWPRAIPLVPMYIPEKDNGT